MQRKFNQTKEKHESAQAFQSCVTVVGEVSFLFWICNPMADYVEPEVSVFRFGMAWHRWTGRMSRAAEDVGSLVVKG